MKKSLFALAAVGAFAGAAQAQSSVTVYGLIDYGFAGSSQTSAGTAGAGTTAQTNSVLKTQNSGFVGSNESTSRLGFRGTEDLGGGTNAFFTAEVALNTDPTATNAGLFSTSATGNRQLFVGLSKKGLGAASIGVQYTPIHEAVAATNAGGTNNQMGDVIYDRSGSAASASYPASGMSTNDSYTVRTTNALILKSERMSGFGLKGMFVSRGTDSTQTSATAGGQSSNTGYGVGVDYQWQKLYLTANFQNFRQETAASTAFTVGYNGGAWTQGVNASDTQQYYAATYDFGILKAFVGYVNRKVSNVNNSSQYVSRTAQQIGVRAPITKTIQAWASAGTGRINNTGSNGPTANFNGWQVGSDYSLSKRTNLYAIYGQSATSNATTGSYSASATGVANSSFNQSSYAVGVRHTF